MTYRFNATLPGTTVLKTAVCHISPGNQQDEYVWKHIPRTSISITSGNAEYKNFKLQSVAKKDCYQRLIIHFLADPRS